MNKKLFALVLVLAMVVSLFAGCGGSSKGSVYWLNFKPESDEALQQVAAMYEKETGVKVKVVTAASGTYEQQLTSELGKSAPPTIFVTVNQTGLDKWSNYVADLKDTAVVKELNTDAYNMYTADGKLGAIGYCYETFGIIVNPDLLEKAGHSVSEITNFATLKAVVEDIHARADELGFDAFTACDMDSSSSWRFTGHLINLEYYYEQEGTTWTEAPKTLSGKYMPYFKNLYDLMINNSVTPPTDLAAGGHDPSTQFKNLEAAFHPQGSWEYSSIAEAVPNATMIPYYCGMEGEENMGLNSGTGNHWVVNGKASEADQKATLDFLYWCVTDPEASRILVDSFGVMPFTHAVESSNKFLAAANEYAARGCKNMNWATNFQPDEASYRPPFVSALNEYNANQTEENWAKVYSAAIDGWAMLLNK